MAYHRRFSSFMSYGIEVWGGSVLHSSKVFIEQKRAIRTIRVFYQQARVGTFFNI